jgi:hypothetical protein
MPKDLIRYKDQIINLDQVLVFNWFEPLGANPASLVMDMPNGRKFTISGREAKELWERLIHQVELLPR